MKSALIILFICLGLNNSFSQANTKEGMDAEQQMLRWCYIYSNQFGYNISSIQNPLLYQNACEWIGVPYRYGGKTKKGIDCSSFACELYQSSYNSDVTGSAKELYNKSKPISKSDLREGDFVFFKIKKKRISHVGVYLGDNKFVHASTNNGVMISDLEDPYYAKYFFKGGRLNRCKK
jgi:lipoprotein Spr